MSDESIPDEVKPRFIMGNPVPYDFSPKTGQTISIYTADDKLHHGVKVTFVTETRGGIYVRTKEGKFRYYSKAQLTYYEWTPEL